MRCTSDELYYSVVSQWFSCAAGYLSDSVPVSTKNFILFLMIAVLCTFFGNVCMSRKADKMFPYLKESCNGHLPKEEKQQIVRNVKAMMMHKIGTVVVSNTDNLLISSFVGVISAGIYSNIIFS